MTYLNTIYSPLWDLFVDLYIFRFEFLIALEDTCTLESRLALPLKGRLRQYPLDIVFSSPDSNFLATLNTADNNVKDFLHPRYKGFFESLCNGHVLAEKILVQDNIISSKQSPICTSTGSDWDSLCMSVNSSCHMHGSSPIQTVYTMTKIFSILIQSTSFVGEFQELFHAFLTRGALRLVFIQL
ncbi:hypothetical protein HKD37_02G004740 [Glycine soja]